MTGPEDLIQVDPDLELLADYLASELDPLQVADVERRLAQDEAFRTRAAPLIALWSAVPRRRREPMSRAVLEKRWDDFTRGAGFMHQRRKRRHRLVLLGTVLVLAVVTAFVLTFDIIPSPSGGLAVVSLEAPVHGPRVVNLRGGSRVELDSGARVTQTADMVGSASLVRLQGAGTFHIRPRPDVTLRALVVETPHGRVTTSNASFRVTVVTDTTRVEVYRNAVRQSWKPLSANEVVLRSVSPTLSAFVVTGGNGATMYRNSRGGGGISGSSLAPRDTSSRVVSVAVATGNARSISGATSLVNRPDSGGSITLRDGTVVELENGAKLYASGDSRSYVLQGAARFRRTAVNMPELVLRTPAAVFLLLHCDLAVSAQGDTTMALLRQRPISPKPSRVRPPPDQAIVLAADQRSDIAQIQLNVGESMRWVRGERPVVTATARTNP